MTWTLVLFSAALAFFLSWVLTAGMRRYALSAHLVDEPNARSSHSAATPRGGGVAVVVTFLLFVVSLWVIHAIPQEGLASLLGSGLVVAVVGAMDDKKHVPARWRFLAHTAAAVWTLFVLNGIPAVPIFGFDIDLGWPGLVLAAVYLVWMVNLCNFMDGIDGVASIEAITVCVGGALTWWLATGTPYWHVPVIFAACVAGFLAMNYPPAKIFMGDSGSGFIGIVLGIFSLWTARQAPEMFWCWFILLGGFVVDATTTLVRRVRRGEQFNEAHRSHAYQYASHKHGSHQRISLAFGLVNLLWLLPVAMLVAVGKLDGVAGVLLAYLPLVWLAFRYKAGVREAQEV